jgi:hypothetical protein
VSTTTRTTVITAAVMSIIGKRELLAAYRRDERCGKVACA